MQRFHNQKIFSELQGPSPWRRIGIILFWLFIWQAGACLIRNTIILVGPWETFLTLFRIIPTRDFWLSIAHSFGKISFGFLAAFLTGILLGSGAYRFPLMQEFLEPVMALMKSTPVASFVILALIWVGSKHLAVLIAFLVVLPIIYVNTLAGLRSTDNKLLEMAAVFRIPSWKKIRFIYVPALLPYLISGCRVALGMSWKSGVAAEVIGLPSVSIGEHLYMAKIYLETADLFAWTFVIILVSSLFEKLFLILLSWIDRKGGTAGETDPS